MKSRSEHTLPVFNDRAMDEKTTAELTMAVSKSTRSRTMQAITTKYLPPTNFKGSRVKVECDAKTIIVPWDDVLNPQQNHAAAARQLAKMLGWHGHWFGGSPKGSTGYCFVCADPNYTEHFEIEKT